MKIKNEKKKIMTVMMMIIAEIALKMWFINTSDSLMLM